ncbi:MAG: hypothetical protein H6Q74_2882 [Firmicutes bacterium]|nr:hypothetical protein [Bacillota bacterium]
MNLQGPAARYKHDDHDIQNVNEAFHAKITRGQKIADTIARVVGSWPFIIIQSIILISWMAFNSFLAYEYATNGSYFDAWDPYPFILLNLVLSFQAAYTGPIVMMSQNRQTAKDRLTAELDSRLNKKAEEEIRIIMEHLVYQDELIWKIIREHEASK